MFLFEMAFTLLMLILLQAVLGFDNLLYISLESKKAPKEDRQRVRSLGIGIAIVLRIALLLILAAIIPYLQKPLFEIGQPIYPHPTAQHSDEGSPKTEKNHDPASKDQTGDAKTKDTKTEKSGIIHSVLHQVYQASAPKRLPEIDQYHHPNRRRLRSFDACA